MPQQFENPANLEVHRRTTAQEILADFRDSPIDVLITGVGTGGHITACAEVLKAEWPGLQVFAVEPTLSPVLSGGEPGPAPDPGHRRRLHPRRSWTSSLLDGIIQVDPADAKEMARRAAREEGMLVGISSGATLQAIAQKLAEIGDGKRVLGFNYDTGERYLSVPGLPARGMSAPNRDPDARSGGRGCQPRWPTVLRRSRPRRCASAGLAVEAAPGPTTTGIGTFDLVLPLLAWGYHRAGPRWAEAAPDWEARGLRLQNPPSVLRWNADKLYLGRLAAARRAGRADPLRRSGRPKRRWTRRPPRSAPTG